MTLCIAALCRDNSHGVFQHKYDTDRRIVFSLDRRIETDSASHEVGVKVGVLGPRWFCLYAGTVWHARELIELYRENLRKGGDRINRADVVGRLQEPFAAFRKRLADSYCWAKLAISHDEYLRLIESQPDAFRPDFAADLEKAIYTDVDLILIGVVNHDIRIFNCNGTHGARHVEDFAIIGGGYYTAESTLFQREQGELKSLSHTLYTLYEAQKAAGGFVPGVSSKFELGLISYDIESDGLRFSPLTPKMTSFLAERYKHFGPKKLTIAELSDDHIEEGFIEKGFLLKKPPAEGGEPDGGSDEKQET